MSKTIKNKIVGSKLAVGAFLAVCFIICCVFIKCGFETRERLSITNIHDKSAPKPISSGKYLIGAFMCPLWNNDNYPGCWEPIKKFPEREPIIGYYNEGDTEVTDWEIKCALEHGISFFNVCWYRKKGNAGMPVNEMFGHWTQSLLESKYSDMFKYCIMYVDEKGVMDGIASDQDLYLNLMPYWIEKHFKRSNYLKIDGKPVLTIYRPENFIEDLGGIENAIVAIGKMKEACIEAGFSGLIVIGEYHQGLIEKELWYSELGLDASVSYHWPSFTEKMPPVAPPDSLIIDLQAQCWQGLQKLTVLPSPPTVSIGWDSRPWGETYYKGHWQLDPSSYKVLLEKAKAYMDQQAEGSLQSKMLMLDNWNEYGEGHYIFPTKENGYVYLEAIREVFSEKQKAPGM